MIQIRFSPPFELDIASSSENFRKLRDTLSELLHSSRNEMVVWAETNFDPSPYTYLIPKLMIRKAQGPAKVTIKDLQEVVVSGSAEALDAMASYLTFEGDKKPPAHCHFEYYDGHPSIHPESIPIVFSVTY